MAQTHRRSRDRAIGSMQQSRAGSSAKRCWRPTLTSAAAAPGCSAGTAGPMASGGRTGTRLDRRRGSVARPEGPRARIRLASISGYFDLRSEDQVKNRWKTDLRRKSRQVEPARPRGGGPSLNRVAEPVADGRAGNRSHAVSSLRFT
jgi:hypothetical protein